MKRKSLKISDTTLFVYTSNKPGHLDETTEPTTTMVTLTVTGILNAPGKKR